MNVLTRKLENFARLNDDDRAFLDEIVKTKRIVTANTNIAHQGDEPTDVHLILSGFASRNKTSVHGIRQIVAYLVPGDFCDLHVAILGHMDHSITAMSDCEVVDIPFRTIEAMSARPQLVRALWWATLVDEATLREWIVNVGTREAREKIAHLFCELLIRLRSIGLAATDQYELPITQRDLADTVGISTVHVNRALQTLRADGLLDFRSTLVTIRNFSKLAEMSSFDPAYLHLADKRLGLRGPLTKSASGSHG